MPISPNSKVTTLFTLVTGMPSTEEMGASTPCVTHIRVTAFSTCLTFPIDPTSTYPIYFTSYPELQINRVKKSRSDAFTYHGFLRRISSAHSSSYCFTTEAQSMFRYFSSDLIGKKNSFVSWLYALTTDMLIGSPFLHRKVALKRPLREGLMCIPFSLSRTSPILIFP